jgi:hypothetical protein
VQIETKKCAYDRFDVIFQGLLVALIELLRVVVRRFLRAHVEYRSATMQLDQIGFDT